MRGDIFFFSNRVFAWLLLVHFFVVERVYMLTAFGKVGLFKNCRPQQASIHLSGVASWSDTEVCIWLLSSVTKCRLIFELFQKSPAVHISGFCSLAFPLLPLLQTSCCFRKRTKTPLVNKRKQLSSAHSTSSFLWPTQISVISGNTTGDRSFIRTVIKYDI